MAIDYVIDYDCVPKHTLGTEGILERLKGRERAHTIIEVYREAGDDRPTTEMGFEFTRRTPEGDEVNGIVVVQDLLDEVAALQPLEQHCMGCPANRTGRPFGCMGFVAYPISEQGELWLLDRLPVPDDLLVWVLLKQVIKEFKYNGASVREWRDADGVIFETADVHGRRVGELPIDANQVFEMLFARRPYILPKQAVLLMLFFNAITRDLEADEIHGMDTPPADPDAVYPFIMQDSDADDFTVRELKAFFEAMHIAWKLQVNLLIDA